LTVEEFRTQYASEEACRKLLYQLRWPNGFCPYCDCQQGYMVAARNVIECQECRSQVSLTSGTAMHASKLPLNFWFFAIFLISSGTPCSARQLSKIFDIHYKSASLMLRKIREAIKSLNVRRFGSHNEKSGSTYGEEPEAIRAYRMSADQTRSFIRNTYRRVRREYEASYAEEHRFYRFMRSDRNEFHFILHDLIGMPPVKAHT
jgi:hypothetical protein